MAVMAHQKNADAFADATAMMDILGHLLALYVAVTMGFVGFGMMLGGPPRAKSVMRFFYLRPLYWAAGRTRWLLLAVLVFGWRALVNYVLRPIWHVLARAWRWLITRERGWLRKWVWPS